MSLPDFVKCVDAPFGYCHLGAPLGNSNLGLLLWGEGCEIFITVGCGGLWDHRGGRNWTPEMNYRNIRHCLEAKDSAALAALFPPLADRPPARPCLVPLGRVVLTLAAGCVLTRWELRIADGLARMFYVRDGLEKCAELRIDMSVPDRFACRADDVIAWRVADSFELGGALLAESGYAAPERFATPDVKGFVQSMPADPAFGLAVRRTDGLFSVAFGRGEAAALKAKLTALPAMDYAGMEAANREWWGNFWAEIPFIAVDNAGLTEDYWLGLYKFGAMSDWSGTPAGLQGPWIEDDHFPPWQGDYHFNINVQMCYAPALRAGRFGNLRKLFEMIWSWRPKLEHYARLFAGVEGGIMLPHATDDTGRCIGGIWNGTIDHACAAWIGMMMYDYYDYTGDEAFLRDVAWPFMTGTMKVFAVMIEEDSGRLAFPVGTSPEFRGGQPDAWGRNASFQLAAVHRLARDLIRAAAALKIAPDPAWLDIERRLPRYSTIVPGAIYDLTSTLPGDRPEIAVWEGMMFYEGHHHHSHLAGIQPFDVIDPESDADRDVALMSRRRWIERGTGRWCCFSLPWAAMLANRFGDRNMSEFYLDLFDRCYRNRAGTAGQAVFRGFCLGAEPRLDGITSLDKLMQLDGTMGAAAAVQDLLVSTFAGRLRIGPGVAERWRYAEVRDMPAPGGFRVSARFAHGCCTGFEVRATRDQELTVELPPARSEWRLPPGAIAAGRVVRLRLKAGDIARFML